jgi:hypothetical protein
MKIENIKIIHEFTRGRFLAGTYSLLYNGEPYVFIRNGDSIGAVFHWIDKPASECVEDVREETKDLFLKELEKAKQTHETEQSCQKGQEEK